MSKRFLVILLTLALLLCAAGCNEATSARDAVQRFEAAMNENEFKTAFLYVADYDGFGFDDDTENIMNAVAASLRISIISENGSATSSQIEADITTIDLRKIYCSAASLVIPQYYTVALSGEHISSEDVSSRMVSEVIALCADPAAPKVTTRVVLSLTTDSDGKWVIRLDVNSYDAITGYLDEANNLITTGTIVQAINGETDFLSDAITDNITDNITPVSGADVSDSDVSSGDAR